MSRSQTTTNVTDTPVDGGNVQTRTTVTRTTYESEVPVYRPLLTPRTTIINRTSYQAPEKRTIVRTLQTSSNVAPTAYSNMTRTGVANVKNDREKEKKDMQDLNERLGGYIEKVRFLEAQNRKLVDELDKLKQKWGKETGAIKAMYQAELDEARKLLDEAEKEKARLEIRCASLEEQIEELRRK
jgi:intermediate filament protein if